MIETKARSYLDKDLREATRQATKLGRQLDVWVTAVICVHDRANTQPLRHKGVWIVPHDSLLEWISAQRNQTLPFERLARFADGL
jgi:hypothetical protein